MRSFASYLGLGTLSLLAACSSSTDNSATPGDDTGISGDTGPASPFGEGPVAETVKLAPACGGELASDATALKFDDATANWELDDDHLGVRGGRLSTADLDGDGYPDLLVHNATARSDPSQPGPKQIVRILMNRPKPGGGRHFIDATVSSGYGAVRADAKPAEGKLRTVNFAIAGDVDNDGDLDLLTATYVDPTKPANDLGDRSEILLNDGKGNFKLADKSDLGKVPTDVLPPTTSATLVDVDRDGILDAWVGYWYKNYGGSSEGVQARLFRGLGDGKFADATKGSGLETKVGTSANMIAGLNHRPAYGVTACDLDDDGLPELAVAAYGRQWNLLYRNSTVGTALAFTEMGRPSGYAGDDNTDFKTNQNYLCHCKISKACTAPEPAVSCTEDIWPKSDELPWRNNGNTFTTLCADLNGDGKRDLFNAEIAHWWAGTASDKTGVLFNDVPTPEAPIRFSRPAAKDTGILLPHVGVDWNEGGITASNGDLDLDGNEDLLVGASDYPDQFAWIFQQNPDALGTFKEVGKAVGLHHACAVGMAIADFDRDGDLDVVIASSTARDCAKVWTKGQEVKFYENKLNDGAKKRGFLQIALEGKGKGGANRSGFGARVKVAVGGKIVTKELQGGYGHFGMQHDTVLHFGLGNSCSPDEIEVRWPNGSSTITRYKGIGGGRRILIKEAGGVIEMPAK